MSVHESELFEMLEAGLQKFLGDTTNKLGAYSNSSDQVVLADR